MALTRPTLLSTAPFDATASHVFNFTTSGDSSVISGNILKIQRNDTLAVIYERRQSTFAYYHELPANILTNGVTYQASIQTYSEDGSLSIYSVPIIFKCLKTPTFKFEGLPIGNVISSNSFSFNLLYNQENNELLNSVAFNLYSVSGALLSTSGSLNDFGTLPVNVSYLFSGFEDNTEYFIEAVGQTVSGMALSTGEIKIIVKYSGEQIFSSLNLENNCNGGYITISTRVTDIEGISYPAPTYIDGNKLDLRYGGADVGFYKGYEVQGNYVVKIWGYSFGPNGRKLNMSTVNGDKVELEYLVESGNSYILLTVTNGVLKYIAESDRIPYPNSDDQIFIMLRKIGNIYQVDIINKGVVS